MWAEINTPVTRNNVSVPTWESVINHLYNDLKLLLRYESERSQLSGINHESHVSTDDLLPLDNLSNPCCLMFTSNPSIFSPYICGTAVISWRRRPSLPVTASLTRSPTSPPAPTLCANILQWTNFTVSFQRPTPQPAACWATTQWETGGQGSTAVRPSL